MGWTSVRARIYSRKYYAPSGASYTKDPFLSAFWLPLGSSLTFTKSLHRIHCRVNINRSFEAVRKYLLSEFTRIHRGHCETMAAVPLPWPAPDVIENLVRTSSGYFIYAYKVLKFIDDKKIRPTERLEVILGTKEPDGGSHFAALDQLYTQILSQVQARSKLLPILAVIAAKLDLCVGRIEQLLELEAGDFRLTLRGLQSVISVTDWDFVSYWSSK
ncbi:hypothetical protein DFH08DRAFT_821703 [Mycena albidolilacea]|uniref:Uncharacterized protein n=1 Tax=Mycena albidolilacea TaxID=1033008 RepID=A0AAD6ZAK1_9AGAR|nr:hypothetical protein DFH08DRAFT_821703 [Mycena albidolilacea]